MLTMNKKNIIYALTTSLALALGSCASEDFWDTFDRTVDGPIDFTVGVESSPAQHAITRSSGEESLQKGTQVRLRAKGIWKRESADSISKTTTCFIKDVEDNNEMDYTNSVPFYWDDFGAGDPDNATHTANGLTVLGVAINGMATAPAVANEADWESLSWPLVVDGKSVNALEKDIIVSNNLALKETYKFAERKTSKKLSFIHPLSKITFNLKAGEGFPVENGNTKFDEDPTLIMSNSNVFAEVDKEENRNVLATGTISIKNGNAKSDDVKSSLIVGTTSTPNSSTVSVIKQALVYPGTQLGENPTDIIAALKVDNSIYYIKAEEIQAAIKEYDKEATIKHNSYKTLPGLNYIIKITVNKTGVRFTASVTDWDKVESNDIYPEIDVTTHIGQNGGGTKPPVDFTSYELWRSIFYTNSYQHEANVSGTKYDGQTEWTFSQPLYWTNHNQHYHLRGLFPLIEDNKVEVVDGEQVVNVSNGSYSENSFPCNFMIGMPEFGTNDYECNSELHTSVDMRTNGICARASAININFRYMMSQVEVELKSNDDTSAKDYVDLTNCKVYLVNVGNEGFIKLSDRSAHYNDGGNKTFELPNTSGKNFHGIIIPQSLVNSDAGKTNKVRIKIEVYNKVDSTDLEDIYYADVAPIKVKKSGSIDEAAAVSAWESGVHYVYNLKITKTEIKATATLTDWQTVEASEDVWF